MLFLPMICMIVYDRHLSEVVEGGVEVGQHASGGLVGDLDARL